MRAGHPLLFTLGMAVLLAITAIAVFLLPLEPSVVRSQFTFSSDAFDAIYKSWSPLAQARFKSHFGADYVFILLYAVWGYLYGRHALSVAKLSLTRRKVVTWLLPIAGITDVIENLFQLRFVTLSDGTAPEWQYMLAGLAATAKWLCAVTFVALASLAHRETLK